MLSPENRKKHVLCSSAFRSATCGRTTGISVYHTAGKCVYHTTGKYVCYLHMLAHDRYIAGEGQVITDKDAGSNTDSDAHALVIGIAESNG